MTAYPPEWYTDAQMNEARAVQQAELEEADRLAALYAAGLQAETEPEAGS
jgi:hypothetical protein